jgi:hypothetical protein
MNQALQVHLWQNLNTAAQRISKLDDLINAYPHLSAASGSGQHIVTSAASKEA